ncbi:FAD-dependent monooxygenase [Actinomadura fulvescens]|uniref:FAD-binding domain-containing protein n=1 Tax=Actinomadura fulvescens TaxID=46160 RepID=A0ABN3QGI4_9ACTN
MHVLISGAGVAGPDWPSSYGFDVTVVERAPALRKTGGHAVDLFRPAMDICEKMGVLPRIRQMATGTTEMTAYREGSARPVTVDLGKVFSAVSDRHVELMRDDLSAICYDATRDYVFGDSIDADASGAASRGGAGCGVRSANGPQRRLDLVVGADGLHSNVRRLVFGPESRFSTNANSTTTTPTSNGRRNCCWARSPGCTPTWTAV